MGTEAEQRALLDPIADALMAQHAGVALTGAGISVPAGIPDVLPVLADRVEQRLGAASG